ncbi:MAG: hypothetical protein WA294_08445 [Acidobacteriaceae bacterium]
MQIAVLLVAAVALIYPFATRGLIAGHDRSVHIRYQHFFNEQIAGGEFYPRWMPGLNLGHGSPIFFVQYPLPYYVAWGFGHLIPNHWGIYTETRTLGLSVVLATILGALFTYAWCATFADGPSALLASAAFLTLPYFLCIDLQLRIAVGEIWALMVLPLAFYFLERRSLQPRRSLAGLATAFALLLLSHVFTAALAAPVLVSYAIWRSEPGKHVYALAHAACALALGTAMAAVYTLPLITHSHFMPSDRMFLWGDNYSPFSQLFPYDGSMFPDDSRGWGHVSWIARWLAAAAAGAVGWGLYRWRHAGSAALRASLAALSIVILGLTVLAGHLPGAGGVPGVAPLTDGLAMQRAHIFACSFLTLEAALLCYWCLPKRKNQRLEDFLMGLALLSYLMMTRWSLVIWKTIHPLQSVFFPWRFNVFVAVATAGLAALAFSCIGEQPLRKRVPASLLAVVVWGLVAGSVARINHVEKAFQAIRPAGFEPAPDGAFPLYVQAKTLQEALDVMAPENSRPDVIVTAGSGKASMTMVNPRLIALNAVCESNCTLQLSQFYYPAWHARLAGGASEVALRPASPGGLMEISLPAGENSVAIALPRDWSEEFGPWISLVSLTVVLLLAFSDKPQAGPSALPRLAAP